MRIIIKGFRVVCGFEHEMIILVMHVCEYDCSRAYRILFNDTFNLSNKSEHFHFHLIFYIVLLRSCTMWFKPTTILSNLLHSGNGNMYGAAHLCHAEHWIERKKLKSWASPSNLVLKYYWGVEFWVIDLRLLYIKKKK